MIRITIIIILVVIKAILGIPDWYSSLPYVVKMLAYPLFHANWFHLAANCLALYTIFNPKRKDNLSALVTGFIISFLAYPLAPREVIGISNLLYAVIGLRTPSFNSAWWKQSTVIVFFVVTFAMLLFPQIGGFTHIVSLGLGIAIACTKRFINEKRKEYERYY